MPDELVTQEVELPGGALRVLQPQESAELPDSGGVEWAPLAPYWSVLWRSGVVLASELDGAPLHGLRIVELGCGMGLPSIAAARAGATVLATDASTEALSLLARNAAANGVRIETAGADWDDARGLLEQGPFDLVLGADLLYEPESVDPLLSLLPRLAPQAWLAHPDRPAAAEFLARAPHRWRLESRRRGVIGVHRLRFA